MQPELSNIFNKYMQLDETDSNYELEARIIGENNISGITKQQYDSLKQYFNEKHAVIINEKKYHNSKNVVKIENNGSVMYIQKKTLDKFVTNENIKYSLSLEEVSNEETFKLNKITYIKERSRTQYEINGVLIHISSFYVNNEKTLKYDCEIECKTKNNIYNFMETVNTISNLIVDLTFNSDKIINEYNSCIKSNSFKFIGTQPHTINNNKLVKNEIYHLSYKLDGNRCLLFVDSNGFSYTITKKMEIQKTQIVFYEIFAGTIFDCEDFDGKLYVFDLLYHKYQKIENSVLMSSRIHALKELVEMCKYNNGNLLCKEYFQADNLYETMTNMISKMDNSKTDGIILAPENPNNLTLKWKPVELNTIDFKVVIKNKYAKLYCYDKQGDCFFNYTDNNYEIHGNICNTSIVSKLENNCIYEMTFDLKTMTFVPLKKREDKVKGNFIDVARDNFRNIVYPFNLESLKRYNSSLISEDTTTTQIEQEKEECFVSMRRFHNWMKRTELQTFGKNKKLLDLACGRGGDIRKWIDCKIKTVEGYDINDESVKEAKQRQSDLDTKNTVIDLNVLDLSCNALKSVKDIDIVTCFFAIHYFFDDLQKFLDNTVNKRLKKGGYFIFTTMDHNRIDYCLEEFDDKEVCISEFTMKRISPFKIETCIKNTIVSDKNIESTMPEESIIDILEKNGLELYSLKCFNEEYNNWKNKKNNLEDYEKCMSFLNKMYVFKKSKTI